VQALKDRERRGAHGKIIASLQTQRAVRAGPHGSSVKEGGFRVNILFSKTSQPDKESPHVHETDRENQLE
jgi:hypothetical protein